MCRFGALVTIGILVSAYTKACALDDKGLAVENRDLSINELKLCRFRDEDPMPENIFNAWAGWACYKYSPASRFNTGADVFEPTICNESTPEQSYPCGKVNETFTLVFDHRQPVMTAIIAQTYRTPAFYRKWKTCAEDATACCENVMNDDNILEVPNFCPTTWDGWQCFGQFSGGNTIKVKCPAIAYSNAGPTCNQFAQKECSESGVWNSHTDYSTCTVNARLEARYIYHVAVLALSIASSLPAIVIFSTIRRLRVIRIALHNNLLIAIVLRNALTIASISGVILQELHATDSLATVMARNGVGCRVLTFCEQLATNWVFCSMFLDGVHVHSLLTMVFGRAPPLLCLTVCLALVCIGQTCIWAAVMAVYVDEFCWMVPLHGIQWINDSLRLVLLLINCVFLLNILRVLAQKLRMNCILDQTLTTLRAFVFLMPLFGMQFFFTVYRPTTSCFWEQFYYFVAYSFDGLQGFIVSLLYCYLNKEIRKVLTLSYKRFKHNMKGRFTISSHRRRHYSDSHRTSSSKMQSRLSDRPTSNAAVTLTPSTFAMTPHPSASPFPPTELRFAEDLTAIVPPKKMITFKPEDDVQPLTSLSLLTSAHSFDEGVDCKSTPNPRKASREAPIVLSPLKIINLTHSPGGKSALNTLDRIHGLGNAEDEGDKRMVARQSAPHLPQIDEDPAEELAQELDIEENVDADVELTTADRAKLAGMIEELEHFCNEAFDITDLEQETQPQVQLNSRKLCPNGKGKIIFL